MKHATPLALLLIGSLATSLLAREKPAEPPTKEPTLDELLGLEQKKDDGAPRPDEARADLDRKLEGGKIEDDFVRATELMKQAAARLGDAKDPGVDTQRIQEDTLKLLDKLIDQAQRQQNKKSKQKKQQQQQQDQQQQQQQQQSSQQQQQQQKQQTSADALGNNSPGQDGKLNPPQTGNAAAWGNLPPHVRDALRQGLGDRFSSMYRGLTEQYYRRLAKEPESSCKPE